MLRSIFPRLTRKWQQRRRGRSYQVSKRDYGPEEKKEEARGEAYRPVIRIVLDAKHSLIRRLFVARLDFPSSDDSSEKLSSSLYNSGTAWES